MTATTQIGRRGGARPGSGRKPKAQGEKMDSVVVRIPEPMAEHVRSLIQAYRNGEWNPEQGATVEKLKAQVEAQRVHIERLSNILDARDKKIEELDDENFSLAKLVVAKGGECSSGEDTAPAPAAGAAGSGTVQPVARPLACPPGALTD